MLEYVRQTLDRETMPQIPDLLRPDTASPMNHPSDTVFEVDPTTRTRLNTAPVAAEDPHNAILSGLIDSVPDDNAPEVLLTYASHTDKALTPEQGPDLISGVVTIDDVTFTTLPSLTSGASAISPFSCRALLDTGSPQLFIHQGAFDQMVATGAADESYVRSTTLRSWSGFGSQELLGTNRQARMTIQFYHNDTPSASLAYGCTLSLISQCDVPSCLAETAGRAFTRVPTKRLYLHMMTAFSVNAPYHTR